jgi:pimeloyl-ACP methyl ester carboxylesterase
MGKFFAGMTWVLLFACALGCATPVGVSRTGKQAIYRELCTNALSSRRPSSYSMQYLERLSLAEEFAIHPGDTLAKLHGGLGGLDEHDRLFALAELSFHHARYDRASQYFLAAAVYAYAFLFPDGQAADLDPYDPRLRMAMDLYNRAITEGLRDPKSGEVKLDARRFTLPFGSLDLSVDSAGFSYGGYRLTGFVSVEDFKIRGLRNHYRKPGIGAALAARVSAPNARDVSRWFHPRAKVPVTAVVRFEQPRGALRGGRLAGRIELYDADVSPSVNIDSHPVPLESDPSAVLAYALSGSPLWDFEIAGFRRGDFTFFGKQSARELFFIQPYRPGRIPVVFVHGTASSPARWAQMLNELLGDSRIASRYQFWFFIYNSGNPIALSAMHLRESLEHAIKELDPESKDGALRNVVVIGHSQGGLLAKMTAVSSGTKFWENVSREPFEKAKLSPETRELLRRGLFVEPLPFVRRIIYIATPHHGSYLAENYLGKIAREFVNLPATLSKTSAELIRLNPTGAAQTLMRIPTAIDNMSWSNPFLRTLYTLPLAPGVKANSIIAVKGQGPVEKGKDGVVRYTSAHIEGVESELVVRSGHSCQDNPHTIEEVRRILYEHAGVHP